MDMKIAFSAVEHEGGEVARARPDEVGRDRVVEDADVARRGLFE
jgi:hypothetical protein